MYLSLLLQLYGDDAQSFPVERNPVKILCSEKDFKEVIDFSLWTLVCRKSEFGAGSIKIFNCRGSIIITKRSYCKFASQYKFYNTLPSFAKLLINFHRIGIGMPRSKIRVVKHRQNWTKFEGLFLRL